jgi:hypothetical protein
MKYREMRQFQPVINDWRITCASTGPHLGQIGFEWKLDDLAAVESVCSFWFREDGEGSWDSECDVCRI